MHINERSQRIIGAAMRVHTVLGPGLLESAYEACLKYELQKRGHMVRSQVTLPVNYDGLVHDVGYRLDLLVDDAVIVELKTVSELLPIHHSQLLSYLRLSRIKLGLLINFNVVQLRDGIARLVNRL